MVHLTMQDGIATVGRHSCTLFNTVRYVKRAMALNNRAYAPSMESGQRRNGAHIAVDDAESIIADLRSSRGTCEQCERLVNNSKQVCQKHPFAKVNEAVENLVWRRGDASTVVQRCKDYSNVRKLAERELLKDTERAVQTPISKQRARSRREARLSKLAIAENLNALVHAIRFVGQMLYNMGGNFLEMPLRATAVHAASSAQELAHDFARNIDALPARYASPELTRALILVIRNLSHALHVSNNLVEHYAPQLDGSHSRPSRVSHHHGVAALEHQITEPFAVGNRPSGSVPVESRPIPSPDTYQLSVLAPTLDDRRENGSGPGQDATPPEFHAVECYLPGLNLLND